VKIAEFLNKENCVASLRSDDKEGALRELASVIASNGDGVDADTAFNAIMEREKLGSTGIGNHIAIPHAKISGVDSLITAFGKSEKGIEYHAMDDKPVRWIFMLLASENSTGTHLKALARISRLFKSERFKEKIETATTPEDIYNLVEEEDNNLD